MKRIGRRPFLATPLALVACSASAAKEDPARSPSQVNRDIPTSFPARPASRPEIVRFQGCIDRKPDDPLGALTGIGSDAPFAKRLFSFTTPAQIAGLRKGDPIFSKSTDDAGHRGFLFEVLTERARVGDLLARTFSGPAFAVGRFAWPFLTGTRASPERYGDEIVSFVLRPEAIIVSFAARSDGFRFFEVSGHEIPEARAMAAPGNIGAFYFVNDQDSIIDTIGTRCSAGKGSVYREFYLPNISMLSQWSIGTQAILDRLAAEVEDLRALAADLDCSTPLGDSCSAILATWARVGLTRPEQLLASLAFATPLGQNGLTTRDLSRIAEELENLRFTPLPLTLDF